MSQPTYWIDSRREGARSKDPEKYKKDALILEKAYEEAKANKDHLEPRYAYYCAQSYKDCGELDKAIHYYMIRTKLGSYQEEVYTAYLYAGRCMISAKRPEAEIEKCFLDGWESMRDRSECLWYLAFFMRGKDNFTKAYLYSSLGCKIPFPNNRFLFLEKDIFDFKIFDECAISSFYTGRYEECYKLNAKLLRKIYDERLIKNMNFCLPYLMEKATRKASYNFNKPKFRIYGVTLTMTSCKRYDLFEKTVHSIINSVKDLYMIERFICIDDNSSNEDRKKMLDNFPFFEFKFKKKEQKGHVESMNMIKKLLTDEDKFIFHIEDDFPFFIRRNYIGKTIRVLRDNPQVSQVLFNRNYAEKVEDYSIKGGIPFGNNKFLIHEYIEDPSKRAGKGCCYWPGFSFRPSIIRKNMLDKVGFFNQVPHFEMEYSYRVLKAGYISVFINGVYGLHIGKLTSEKDKPNAYTLNDVKQF
jgi:GT2 family glycosyltransferase